MTSEPPFSPLALLGTGYIGGSVALAARLAGVARILGYDADPASAALARERGIIDEAAASPEQAVAGAALVVLAAPVGSLGALARRIAGAVAPGALVIDVGSVKSAVVSAVEAAMPSARFVVALPVNDQ